MVALNEPMARVGRLVGELTELVGDGELDVDVVDGALIC